VLISLAITLALGMVAPDGSVTRPESVDLNSCADNKAQKVVIRKT
jgi:hypothetical protein